MRAARAIIALLLGVACVATPSAAWASDNVLKIQEHSRNNGLKALSVEFRVANQSSNKVVVIAHTAGEHGNQRIIWPKGTDGQDWAYIDVDVPCSKDADASKKKDTKVIFDYHFEGNRTPHSTTVTVTAGQCEIERGASAPGELPKTGYSTLELAVRLGFGSLMLGLALVFVSMFMGRVQRRRRVVA